MRSCGQRIEHRERADRVFDETALGHLQREQRRRQLMTREQSRDPPVELRIGKIVGADIDREL